MGDVAGVSSREYGFEDGWIIDFLGIVEFASPRIARRMVVTDVVFVFPDASDDVSVHDRDMIDVEQQFEIGRSDLFDEIDAEIDIVAEVSGMPLHRMGAVSGIEMFQDESNPRFFGM